MIETVCVLELIKNVDHVKYYVDRISKCSHAFMFMDKESIVMYQHKLYSESIVYNNRRGGTSWGWGWAWHGPVPISKEVLFYSNGRLGTSRYSNKLIFHTTDEMIII